MGHAVPTIDIAALFGDDTKGRREASAEILQAVQRIGFVCITGAGIAPSLVRDMRAAIIDTFAVPETDKYAQAITRDNYRGYIPFGFFTPNDGSGTPDNYEGFKLHRQVGLDDPIRVECALYGPNIWPLGAPHLEEATLAYWAEMDRITHALLRVFSIALDLPDDTLGAMFAEPLTNMTLLHYPPQAPNDMGFGIHAHKDTDAMTIISPDPVGGLEVRMPDGTWHVVDCPPDGFIVNIGDMLELWSAGRFVSTPHRVVNKSGSERYSFPYFAVPSHDVVVAPLVKTPPEFNQPSVHCGHWSAETWRTNWPDETVTDDTPALGTIHN
jgi:isopenicillin N synthase-like dioxygenase